MKITAPPLTEFDDLRRKAVEYAQDASREQWSDYNVHDPGVTLMEQTCFALSQLAYQSSLPIRDLLTTPRHTFLFREIGMVKPRKVLGSQPVTDSDLETWISACDAVESVKLIPRGAAYPGQYDITAFPAHDSNLGNEDLENAVRTAFARRRPLCTALNIVRIAQRIDVKLTGQIEIAPGILPETIAANVYHSVHDILAGRDDSTETQTGATRRAVYDAPERLLPPRGNLKLAKLSLENHISSLRKLPGILEIDTLGLAQLKDSNPLPSGPFFFHCVLPRHSGHKPLELTLNNARIPLDPTRIREEYTRIRAERAAHSHHQIHAPDWDVMKPGRPRAMSQSHVDSLLPSIYRATGYETGQTDSTIGQYRHAIDGVLQDINAALANLPNAFQAGRKADFSDPVVHRERIALLDYLISLQGFEMPDGQHTGIHCYRCTTSMHRFEIQWRQNALNILPGAQAARGSGPGPTAKDHGGFLTMVALMCDLDIAEGSQFAPALTSYGLRVEDDAPLSTPPTDIRVVPIRTYDLLDLVPIAIPDAAPFDAAQLADYSPFLANNTVAPKVLRRLADPDCFFILPAHGGKWQVVADLGDGAPLWPITAFFRDRNGTNDPRDDARLCAARLRSTWLMLNRGSECLRLIEPVLSANDSSYLAYTADLVLPNWTARCALESYRTYVQSQLDEHAPAHLMIRLHWLSVDQSAAYQALIDDNATSMALHTFLNLPVEEKR